MNKIIFTAALLMAASIVTLPAQVKKAKTERQSQVSNSGTATQVSTDEQKQKPSSAERKSQAEADVKAALDAKRYVFVAERVFPTTGKTRVLTSRYDLAVSPDTVTAYLPYFGRAYTAPVDPTEGGIKFASTDFTYEATPAKKDSREIKIVPKDGSKRYELFMTVYPNGTATLTVNDVQRQTIRFNGRIERK